MADKVSTSALLKRIIQTKNLTVFLRRNEQHMRPTDFCTRLKAICEERGLVAERVILQSQIERTYGHQLFNGIRRPSRDKVLQIAIALGLSVEETQQLLRSAAKSPLYPRLKRDAAIIYCLKNGLSMIETQEMLNNHGMTLLGDVKKDAENN